MTEFATTIDHDQICRWVEARDGTPAAVRAIESDDDPGVLRVRFRDESAGDLDAIDWDEFFAKFDSPSSKSRTPRSCTRTRPPTAAPAASRSS